jgi:hypothetical protein
MRTENISQSGTFEYPAKNIYISLEIKAGFKWVLGRRKGKLKLARKDIPF